MTRRALRSTAWAACALVVAACVAFAAMDGWSQLRADDLVLRPGWLLASTIALVAFQLGAALLWRSLVAELGTPLGLRPAMVAWNASLPARFVPTGLLMPIVRAGLAEPHGLAPAVCVASVAYEAILGIAGFLVVAAGFLVATPTLAGEPARWLLLGALPVALAVLHPAVVPRIAGVALRRLGRDPLPASLAVRDLARYLVLYAALVVAGGAALYALAQALHPIAVGDAPTVIGAFAAGSAFAALAFVLPGGLGAREAGIVLVLSAIMPAAIALPVAVAFRLAQLVVEVVLGVGAAALAARTPGGPTPPAPSPRPRP